MDFLNNIQATPVRYDDNAKPQESDNLADLDVTIVGKNVKMNKTPSIVIPPKKEEECIPPKGKRRKSKQPEKVIEHNVKFSGYFGEATIKVVGISRPGGSDIAAVLLSGEDGFTFVPPVKPEPFTMIIDKTSHKVVHVGLRAPSPTGVGELLILLGVNND